MEDTGSDAKRLLKNENRRRWYAQLSDGKKNEMLQKKRARYAASKRPPPIGNQSIPSQKRNRLAQSDELSYISDACIMVRVTANESTGTRQKTSSYAPDKGKAKISCYNLLHTDETHHLSE